MAKVKLTNLQDTHLANFGLIRPEQVRTLELDALVDTGAVMTALPEEVVEVLGLRDVEKRKARLADGTIREFRIVTGLELEVCGRQMPTNAWVLPRGTTPLLGQIPLEELDLVVVPSTGEVMVNPASGGAWVLDLLHVA